jgi:hypothetical protein
MATTKQKLTKKEEEAQLRKNPINEFTCCNKTMPFKEFKEHLTTEHKLNADQLKGKKSMLMHMDGDYWFSYNWQWELETGLKFTQYTMQVRAKDDMMRFEH